MSAFMAYDTMVVDLMSEINLLMSTFVHDGYNALALALKAPLAATGTLFIVLMGYGITKGFIKAPLQELYKFVLRIGLIYFFAMNWGNFSFYVVDLFDKAMGQLSSTVMNATHTPTPGKSIEQGLQTVLTEVFHVGFWTMKKVSYRNWWPYYTAYFIWFSGIAVVAVAFFEIVVAKIMLALCLATAPLFFLCTLFDKTRSFFDRWLGSVVGSSLVLVFVSAVVGLCMSLVHASIASALADEAAGIGHAGWAPIFMVACLTVPCLLQAANIAKHIGGACHTAGGSVMVGGVVGGALGASMGVMRANDAWKQFREGSKKGGSTPFQHKAESDSNPLHFSTRGAV